MGYKNHKTITCQCAICKSIRGEYKGKNNRFYGKKHTEKTKRKMRENHKRPMLGKKMPDWFPDFIRKTRSGKNNPNYGTHWSKERKIQFHKKMFGRPQKNGQYINNGYIYILFHEHPFKNSKGYVRRSRLIMEKKLGRYLIPIEKVHHINGIKNDDRIKNLKLFPNVSEHSKFHQKLLRKKRLTTAHIC